MKRSNSELIGDAIRCTCNKLLMTVLEDAIIVKCSRCKRYLVVETSGILSVQIYDLEDGELEQLLTDTGPGPDDP